MIRTIYLPKKPVYVPKSDGPRAIRIGVFRETATVAGKTLSARKTVWFYLLLTLALGVDSPGSFAQSLALRVTGNKLYNTNNQVVRLVGVNVPAMEWSNDGEGRVLSSMDASYGSFKSNHIRLPLAQDRWFGKASGQSDGGAAYRKIVADAVAKASAAGKYIVLDLHWSDMGVWGSHIGQHYMPDNNSTTFWQDVAAAYKNHPAVLFDLYNEPHNVSWSVWRNGGSVTEAGVTYQSPGMQALYNTVRNTGANNVVIVGGLDWAYDLTGASGAYALDGFNIMLAAHYYPWKSKNGDGTVNEAHRAAMVDVAKAKYPVYVGELGWGDWINPPVESHPTWFPKAFGWIDTNEYSWSGWSMHPGGGPAIITDWSYATVTESNGKYIKNQLVSYASPSPSDTQAPTAPTGLWNTSKSSTTMNWTWTAATDNVGVTAYELFVNGETTPRVTTATTSASLTGLSPGTSYGVKVRARDAAGNISGWSNYVVVTTNAGAADTQAPTTPTGLWNTSKSSTTLNWAWNAATDNVGVTAYELFVNGETTPRATTAATSASLTGLSPSTSYSVRVRAKDAAGNVSALSTNVVVTTNASGRLAFEDPATEPGTETLAYPNPVTGTLKIRAKDIERATMVNLNGRQVITTRSDVINVTHLPAGLYLLKVQTKTQHRVMRIMKQ
jgi:chitodextrinase